MLWSEVIDSSKERVENDRNNEYNLKDRPPEPASVTKNCNPWQKQYPSKKILNDIDGETSSQPDRAYWKNSKQ